MARDPLQTVLQLRRNDVDAARAALMECESQAQSASQAEKEALATIQSEMQAAAALSADDAVVEAFGAWLPLGRAAVSRASATLARAEDDATQARAVLNLARAAAEAVEKLIEKRDEEVAREALRREQIVLDEVSQRQTPRRF